jgi:cell division protein FtsQ
VVAVRRGKHHGGGGWTWRLGGVVLCAFFACGYLSGLGTPRSAYARRLLDTFKRYKLKASEEAALVRQLPLNRRGAQPARDQFAGAVAMVERRDGFYALFGSGELRGPVSASAEDNLPIISGAALEAADSSQLVEYASVLVRAEAILSELISEMQLGSDGETRLFLDDSRIQVVLDLDRAPLELERAAVVLRRWRGREADVVSLDMTTPGQAVVRLRTHPAQLVAGAKVAKPATAAKPAQSTGPARARAEAKARLAAQEASLR